MNVTIHHWRYEDGNYNIPEFLRKPDKPSVEYRPEVVGWHCWAYPDDFAAFEEWMEENMKFEYDATRRFNSGNPMITVHIKNDEDATLFKLKWV